MAAPTSSSIFSPLRSSPRIPRGLCNCSPLGASSISLLPRSLRSTSLGRIGFSYSSSDQILTSVVASSAPVMDPTKGEVELKVSTIVDVDLGDQSYPIYIGSGLLDVPDLLQSFLRHVAGKRVLFVTNTTIAPLYLDRVVEALTRGNSHVSVDSVILPDGEKYKDMIILVVETKLQMEKNLQLGFRQTARCGSYNRTLMGRAFIGQTMVERKKKGNSKVKRNPSFSPIPHQGKKNNWILFSDEQLNL